MPSSSCCHFSRVRLDRRGSTSQKIFLSSPIPITIEYLLAVGWGVAQPSHFGFSQRFVEELPEVEEAEGEDVDEVGVAGVDGVDGGVWSGEGVVGEPGQRSNGQARGVGDMLIEGNEGMAAWVDGDEDGDEDGEEDGEEDEVAGDGRW